MKNYKLICDAKYKNGQQLPVELQQIKKHIYRVIMNPNRLAPITLHFEFIEIAKKKV